MNKIRKFVRLVNEAVDLAEEMDLKEKKLNAISEEIRIVVNELEHFEIKEISQEIEKVLNEKADNGSNK